MSHLSSNIHSKMFYTVFRAEMLRTSFGTNKNETLSNTADNLISTVVKQRADFTFFGKDIY